MSERAFQSQATLRIVGAFALVLLALAAGTLGALWMGRVAMLGAPLVVGVIWASAISNVRWSVAGAALSGGVAVGLAYWGLSSGAIAALLVGAPPMYLADIPPTILTTRAAEMMRSSSVLSLGSPLVAAFVSALVAAVVAWVSGLLVRRGDSRWWKHVPAAVVLAFICAGMASSAWSSDFREVSTQIRANDTYGVDAAIYQQTSLLMQIRDSGYYEELVTAAAGDSRLIAEGAIVDGKFVSWAHGPSFIRLPFVFGMWKAAQTIGLTTFDLALTFAMLLVVGSYIAFSPHVGGLAVAVPAVLFPAFVAHGTWLNLFFPDYWAALFSLAAVFLVLRERWLAAGVFALAAALCREVAAVWLVFLVLGALAGVVIDKERQSWRDLGAYAVAFGVFGLALLLHERAASAIIAATATAPTIMTMLQDSAARELSAKFVEPAGYLMYPFGFFIIPPVLSLLLAPLGYLASTSGRPWRLRSTLLAAALFWPAFTATVGATSSYWGQQYTMLAIVGVAALFAWLAGQPDGGHTAILDDVQSES